MRTFEMIKQSKQNNNEEIILQKLDALLSGDFKKIDVNEFPNPEIGKKLNALIDLFISNNNEFVMQLNESMNEIGDSSCVKDMFAQLDTQTLGIRDLRESSDELGASIEQIAENAKSISDNSHEAISSAHTAVDNLSVSSEMINRSCDKFSEISSQIDGLQENINQINNIIDIVKKIAGKSSLLALNASIEAARAGDAGRGFMVVANQMQELAKNTAKSSEDVSKYVLGLKDNLSTIFNAIEDTTEDLSEGNTTMKRSVGAMQSMNDTLESISRSIDTISDEINSQYALTESFISSVDVISESYNALQNECMDTGSHLYKISRKVDKVRTHMAKKVSNLSTSEWIDVFRADHLIFTWRQYNNLVGFEKLELQQVNNPDGCKLGKWLAAQRNNTAFSASLLKEIDKVHRSLHKNAVNCFNATKSGHKNEALSLFELIYSDYLNLEACLKKLSEELK